MLVCSGAVAPAAVIMSGDEVMVEMATHHAGDDYEKMVKGDSGMEDVFTWTQSKMNVPFRGRTGARLQIIILLTERSDSVVLLRAFLPDARRAYRQAAGKGCQSPTPCWTRQI